jgi:UDP-4-amino-4-deoxy-L-arabinose formyltransferase/UDP-glucuronic acid dehydrogenase (UDP-4-keto-hexauronic acid decarboxylating)
MKVAIIGRTEILYDTAELLMKRGHEITLIVTAKAAPEYTRTEEDFKVLAEHLNAPFVYTARIAETSETIRSLAPVDIAVSINYPGVIPSEVIDLFPFGVLNAHGGDLPRYRGNACQAWAILNGEDRVGLCIHKMVGGELDSGDIITRDYHPLTAESTITDVYCWMVSRTPALFAQALDLLAADPTYVLEHQSQNPADALRCYPRKPEDGVIDWNRSAVEILRLINASTKPYAGAFTYHNGEKVRIWNARMSVLPCPSCFVPGQVLWKNEDGSVAVGTGGSGVLLLDMVQKETGEPYKAAKMVRSLRERFGEVLVEPAMLRSWS